MATIGLELDVNQLVLTKGRDFKWNFQPLDDAGNPVDFPPGDLYFEFDLGSPKKQWQFEITGDLASIKVESTEVDTVPPRTKWQLVFLADGEPAGGDPIARGITVVQQ
ncbi:hypothetical protein A5630_23145 [Mycolicibacterium mucogenicum]|uniref:LtfC/p132/Gp6 beta-sandwich domain-containing protein n=1 Tax=Mycolicibacterium mucogenicum TaxID=56689 RepID=A0A1A3H150_MYCMU|nr:hypothetical protein [Mycolicibacterium mucogenicum]OBJ41336.1 hypothetical protein A5630_23145 [Mycolicibacterium mucogenicum]